MTPANTSLEPPPRILIVDDEEIVLVALRQTLLREGYEVTAHCNPLEALEALGEERFSVIISDQQMPPLTGLEFLAQVKEIQPDATRILITAVLNLDTVIDAINTGEIYRFIVKPWLREELLVTVKNAVQRHELICRNAILQADTASMNQKLQQLNDSLAGQVNRVDEQNQHLACLNRELEENLQNALGMCRRMVEAFCPILGSEARRVHHFCSIMAGILDLSPEERKVLSAGAWLYDAGLIGMPRPLIRRWQQDPETLTEAELHLIHQHPVRGAELAQFAHPLEAVGPVIRAHHERVDGRGYPGRLHGDEIPWLARLLAVALNYAASRRDAQATAEAIQAASGSAFDPEAVRVFFCALPIATAGRKEREVLLSELQPGMVLARSIYTARGCLLASEGQRLDHDCIEKLLDHNRASPIHRLLVVYG